MDEKEYIPEICRLPHTTDLQQLCDLAYRILGNPVFVCDMAHTILAYTRCVKVSDPLWSYNIVQGTLERNTLFQDREVSIVHENSITQQSPVLVEDSYQDYPRLIKTLNSKNSAVGVMVVTSYFKPFDDYDRDLVELIASFMLPIMERERFSLSAGEKSVEIFFRQLLEGAQYSSELVNKRLQVLNYPIQQYIYVLCICEQREVKPPRNGSIHSLLEQFSRISGCHTFLYNTTLVCIYGGESDITDWNVQAQQLTGILKKEGLLAGISRRVESIHHLREYYGQARDVLEIGRKLVREETLYFLYDSYSSFLLLQCVPEEELSHYCHQNILSLWEYDQTHNTELCITLQVYLEQAKSLSKAADILYIHRNTVRYRIHKCMELMKTDFEDGNDIFTYILSLRILEFQKKLAPGAFPYPGLSRGETFNGQ